MNLFFIFLSIFFSTVSPSFTNNEGTGSNNGTTATTPEPGGGKKDKFGNGDFIITSDIMP